MRAPRRCFFCRSEIPPWDGEMRNRAHFPACAHVGLLRSTSGRLEAVIFRSDPAGGDWLGVSTNRVIYSNRGGLTRTVPRGSLFLQVRLLIREFRVRDVMTS